MQRFLLVLAMSAIGCGGAPPNRVVLYCAQDRPFAEHFLAEFTQQTGIAVADLPIMYVNDQTITQKGVHGILESYSAGPYARAWASMNDNKRRRELLTQLDLIYPGVSRHVMAHAMFNWDTEPYSRGAYACFEPGQLQRQYPIIRRPEGRLHFAGDHCSSLPGWMQGAFESGHDVAVEVHNAS